MSVEAGRSAIGIVTGSPSKRSDMVFYMENLIYEKR